MTTTPEVPTTSTHRFARRIGLVSAVALGFAALAYGANVNAAGAPPSQAPGYSYYHDSRITETPAGYSADHDSRIDG